MRFTIYNNFAIYNDKKIEDGIFLLNNMEYIVIVKIDDFDPDLFIYLEETSKFHSENMVMYKDGSVRFQLVFECLSDARDFIENRIKANLIA